MTIENQRGRSFLKRISQSWLPAALLATAALPVHGLPTVVSVEGNLAPRAKITADHFHSEAYRGQKVADGLIPQNFVRSDHGQVWITETDYKGQAMLTFEWPKPVTIAEVLYYGATAHNPHRCWKDYEVFLDGGTEPVVTGSFVMRHGPQRVLFPEPRTCSRMTMRFLTSYGGRNPGAAEIMVFPRKLGDEELLRLREGADYEMERSPESGRLRDDLLHGRLGFDKFIVVQRHAIQPSHVYTYHQEGHRPGGGLYVAHCRPSGVVAEKILDSPEGEILDSNLSYDGRRVLFSWRRTMGELMQIYLVNIDGSGLRKVVDHDSNNVNPCWLPDGGIAFLSDRKPAFAYCWNTTSPVLYRCDLDGGNVTPLSANYLNDFTPSVMLDGRILYSRWEYVDKPAIPIQSLWTINQDGTGLAGFFGNRVLSPATFVEARQIPGSERVLCVMTAHNGPCRGAIGIIDPSHGPNAQKGITNLTPEIVIPAVDVGNGNDVRGPYSTPVPIDDRGFFVTRDGSVLLRDYGRRASVTVLEGEAREWGSDSPGPSDKLGFYGAQPIRGRTVPTITSSGLDRQADEWATLVLQDVYLGLEPHVKRGEVKQIAVVEEVAKPAQAEVERRAFGFQFPVVSCGATYAPKRVWGFARVEKDGSAHFKVPAGKPIYFMALDGHGRAVQRMRTFTHLMPGERQSCVGCHSNRNSAAPPNNPRPIAALRPAQPLAEPEWGVTGFSYPAIVQPVLDEHCVSCHNARDPQGGLDLGGDKTDFFNVSYEYLARECSPGESRYTSWIPTYNGHETNILRIEPHEWGSPASLLADLVLGGHPDQDGEPRVELDDASRHRLFTWLDLNVPYYGTSESNHYDLPGCRQIVPADLDKTLADVAERRCYGCHTDAKDRTNGSIYQNGRIHRKAWTRITHPELNNFLLAPLPRSAGGTQTCGKAVFASKDDPDYRAILATFGASEKLIREVPRVDMVE